MKTLSEEYNDLLMLLKFHIIREELKEFSKNRKKAVGEKSSDGKKIKVSEIPGGDNWKAVDSEKKQNSKPAPVSKQEALARLDKLKSDPEWNARIESAGKVRKRPIPNPEAVEFLKKFRAKNSANTVNTSKVGNDLSKFTNSPEIASDYSSVDSNNVALNIKIKNNLKSAELDWLSEEFTKGIGNAFNSAVKKIPGAKLDFVETFYEPASKSIVMMAQAFKNSTLKSNGDIGIKINRAFFNSFKSLSELNKFLSNGAKQSKWVFENLEELLMHEIIHTRIYQGLTPSRLLELNNAMENKTFGEKFSRLGKQNGIEGLAEGILAKIKGKKLDYSELDRIIKKYIGDLNV